MKYSYPLLVKHIFLAAALLFSPHVARSAPIGAVVQSSNYDAAKRVTSVRIVNTSQKPITAISLLVRIAHPDGTVSVSQYGGDFTPFMAYAATAGPQQQDSGALAPGAVFTLDVPMGQQNVETVSSTVDVVVYDDATADVLNQQAFQSIAAQRKGRILGLQRADELLEKALADANDPHPSITVAAQLKALAKQDNTFEGMGLLDAAADISNAPKSSGRSQKEDDYLRELIKMHGNRISFLLPHTQLTKQVRA
jgi:hypothetical protein